MKTAYIVSVTKVADVNVKVVPVAEYANDAPGL
jgi:hypothetical protein